MCEITGPPIAVWQQLQGYFSCLTRCAVSAQEAINTVWYRFALYTAKRVGRWPNYTTGELYDLPELRYNVRRGRIETAQLYQFNHAGQSPNETTV